ncbi:MAG: hypothetical protein ACLP0L_15500 [Solirubrobacteraceae bacterium]
MLSHQASTAKTTYFDAQVAVIRALAAAGFETEAHNQAQALIEANPRRPIPADIRGLEQRLGWWRLFLGDVGPPARTALELLIGVLAVIAVALLAFQAVTALVRRGRPPTYAVGTVSGVASADVPRHTAAIKAELSGLSAHTLGPLWIRRAGTEEQAISIPTAITTTIPDATLLEALVSLLDRLLPRRLTKVNLAALPEDPTRGVGLTVEVATRSGRVRNTQTIWESDYYHLAKAPSTSTNNGHTAVPDAKQGANADKATEVSAETDAASRLERLLLPAAVWLAYQPQIRTSTPLWTTKWESYAHFAVAERAQGAGDVKFALLAYSSAIDHDRENRLALLNLAGLKLYRGEDEHAPEARPATGEKAQANVSSPGQAQPTDLAAHRLTTAGWLLMAAGDPTKTTPGSAMQLRWLYLCAAYGLYSNPAGPIATAFADALWKQFDPAYPVQPLSPVELYNLLAPPEEQIHSTRDGKDEHKQRELTDLERRTRDGLMKHMRLPAMILLQSALVEQGALPDIEKDRDLAAAWWDSNIHYNLACFYARKVAKSGKVAKSDGDVQARWTQKAHEHFGDALERTPEPELLVQMARSDPALDPVRKCLGQWLDDEPPKGPYAGDIEIGRGWGVRVHEALKAGVFGEPQQTDNGARPPGGPGDTVSVAHTA